MDAKKLGELGMATGGLIMGVSVLNGDGLGMHIGGAMSLLSSTLRGSVKDEDEEKIETYAQRFKKVVELQAGGMLSGMMLNTDPMLAATGFFITNEAEKLREWINSKKPLITGEKTLENV